LRSAESVEQVVALKCGFCSRNGVVLGHFDSRRIKDEFHVWIARFQPVSGAFEQMAGVPISAYFIGHVVNAACSIIDMRRSFFGPL
jgi:hypothetical protein